MIRAVTAYGTSMSPIIKNGDTVLYSDSEKIKNGDIVFYQFEGKNYIHRLVGFFDGYAVIGNDDDLEQHCVDIRDIKGKVLYKNSFFNLTSVRKILKIIRVFRKWIYQKNLT
jgi:SOS-response transcriptional repressor LexA